MNLRKAFPMLAFGVCIAAGAVLLAQQAQPRPAQPRQPAQPGQIQPQPAGGQVGQTGQRPVWMTTDQHVASCLAISNQLEVAIAEFAHQRADDKEVQEFAQMLIDDHSAFLKKLERWAPQAARDDFLKQEDSEQSTERRTQQDGTTTATPDRDDQQADQQRRDNDQQGQARDADQGQAANRNQAGQANRQAQAGAANQPAQPGTRIQQTAGNRAQSGQGSQPVNIMQLDRELAKECLNTSKQLLSSKEGDEFNKCFAGMQFMVHNAMQDKLTVFQRHVSDELAQVLSDASTTVDEHLTRAEELMKKFDGGSERVAKDKDEAERK